MNRFEIFRFEGVLANAFILVEFARDVPHHVFNELGIVVGTLGDVFLVRTLEQSVKFAGCLLLDDVDDFLDPDKTTGARVNGYVRALVVRSVILD